MEAHLRYEYREDAGDRDGFAHLIDASPLPDDLKGRLHDVRRFRNRWVHVRTPAADEDLLERPNEHRAELAAMASDAMRLLRELMYREQWL